jgi:hypothetical protein
MLRSRLFYVGKTDLFTSIQILFKAIGCVQLWPLDAQIWESREVDEVDEGHEYDVVFMN